jgi:molybdopterin biosynthesis enzyme
MSDRTRVDEFLSSLLAICRPLEAFEMSLLDAHGATLAADIYAGERLVLKSGSRIRSTQIGLAASIGRDHLPIISGERNDDSFDLITRTLSAMGEITTVDMAIESSGRHNFGVIGPDKTPVVTLPGDPVAAYISFELFIRPMIRTMLGAATIHRPSVKAKLEKAITSSGGYRSYIRAVLSEDGKSVLPLLSQGSSAQDEQATLSDANAFIAVPEGDSNISAGSAVTVVVLERRYI